MSLFRHSFSSLDIVTVIKIIFTLFARETSLFGESEEMCEIDAAQV